MLLRILKPLIIAGFAFSTSAALAAADTSAKQPEAATQQPAPGGASGQTPKATAESAAKGELKNPYQDFAKVADEGHKKFMAAGCNGCHGGGGGGGMGPPLTNEVWIYGKDDDTLFRIVALGSDGLKAQGYARKGSENVVGPMPAMGTIVKSDDDMWKIIAWIRSVNPSSASASADSSPPAQ
jgi:mono/diheme cytochrome c family protein